MASGEFAAFRLARGQYSACNSPALSRSRNFSARVRAPGRNPPARPHDLNFNVTRAGIYALELRRKPSVIAEVSDGVED
jgi:hypothetical protein